MFLLSRWIDEAGYLDHATVQHREDVVDEGGPGTALMECDPGSAPSHQRARLDDGDLGRIPATITDET